MLEEDIASDAMMNNILGAVAFYEVYDGQLELLRVNEQYCALTGTSAVELEEQRKFILKDTREEDREHAFGIFTQAYENPLKGAEGDLRRRKGEGTYMWMHLRVSRMGGGCSTALCLIFRSSGTGNGCWKPPRGPYPQWSIYPGRTGPSCSWQRRTAVWRRPYLRR